MQYSAEHGTCRLTMVVLLLYFCFCSCDRRSQLLFFSQASFCGHFWENCCSENLLRKVRGTQVLSTLGWSYNIGLVSDVIKFDNSESVVIMPTLGVQLETLYLRYFCFMCINMQFDYELHEEFVSSWWLELSTFWCDCMDISRCLMFMLDHIRICENYTLT